MPSRHKSRQRALQVLFQADLRGQHVDAAIDNYYGTLYSEESEEAIAPDPFMEQLARGAWERLAEIDARIAKRSENWRVERMPAVDRNILRLAIFEMTNTATPAPVVIDEAIELARRFSGDESVAFINGVLDAVRREEAARTTEPPPASPDPADSGGEE